MNPSLPRLTAAPAVQASYMKNLFATLEKQGRLAALRERDAPLVEEVEASARVSWLPIELNVRTVDAMAEAFGAEQGLAILAECVYDQFDSPLWKNFVAGAVRLLGKDPGSLGRWIPQAFQLIFRGCGDWAAEAEDGLLTVTVSDLPHALATHRRWLESLAVGMHPLFTLCGTDGRSELFDYDPDGAGATYVLTWKERD